MYDLEERLLRFSKNLLFCIKNMRIEYLNRNIVDQVIRSGTSIGANYCEANGANGKKDFANKIHICKKEAKETTYRLELLTSVIKNPSMELVSLLKESKEIMCIFNKIAQKVKTY